LSGQELSWSNWGGNYTCHPTSIELPKSEEEIIAIIRDAGDKGQKVKVASAGHSFTDIACTDGRMIKLDDYNQVLDVDRVARTVKVQGGINLWRLGEVLAENHLSQPNLGDVAYQSIAGAVSTATHGTGAQLGNISSQVVALTLVLADGSVLECSPLKDIDTFKAAQVSLGSLGVISTITLQCEPQFNLHSIEEPARLDNLLAQFDELVEANDHFEFFWLPHTNKALSIRNNRTHEPAKPRGRFSEYINDVFLENRVFGLICGIGKLWNGAIPTLNRILGAAISGTELTDQSHRVFANPRLVRFVEMEYAVPREAIPEVVREVRQMIDSRGHRVSFPIEVRTVASDNIMLSTAHGRPSGYVAVHMYRGMEYRDYFRDVEAIMNAYEGRPHWGKFHFQTAETLAPRYPHWDRFLAVRKQLDPSGRFSNNYLERVLGPPSA
jgi:L-gulonolactone oxidase